MAIYHMDVKTFGRAKGGRATRAAAYRAGERIKDERTRETYNHSDRNDVVHKEIMLPADFAGDRTLDWARDRSVLWNAAEHTHRSNARVAREVMVLLPPELTPEQRTQLVRGFSQELADRFRCAVDTTVHLPRPGADPRNHHAHMLMTVREVTAKGFGQRTTLELSGMERHTRGLASYKEEFVSLRERWAHHTNEALREAGLEARVDHRSYRAQGINAEPGPSIPQKIWYMERNLGTATKAGDGIRARHRERVQAREKGPEELARVLAKQKEEGHQRAIERDRQKAAEPKQRTEAKKVPELSVTRVVTPEDGIREWRAYREAHPHTPTAEDGIREYLEYRKTHGPGPTEEEALKEYREYRQTHGPGPTAEEAAKNWHAYRESERQKALNPTHKNENDKQNVQDRSRDNDYGLE